MGDDRKAKRFWERGLGRLSDRVRPHSSEVKTDRPHRLVIIYITSREAALAVLWLTVASSGHTVPYYCSYWYGIIKRKMYSYM